MKMLRTIVVEDERLPRLSLLAKLDELSHTVEVVDSCADYDSARMSILRHRPDLLLLDIQLQGRDSMQLLDELKQTITLPYVIFTTAYSDHCQGRRPGQGRGHDPDSPDREIELQVGRWQNIH